MDNRKIDIRSRKREALDMAVALLFDNAAGGKATHYVDDPERGLILLWFAEPNATAFPYPQDRRQAAETVWGWLEAQPDERYIDKGDHDGSNGKGFRVYNEGWGHVGGRSHAILAVQPCWAWFGK